MLSTFFLLSTFTLLCFFILGIWNDILKPTSSKFSCDKFDSSLFARELITHITFIDIFFLFTILIGRIIIPSNFSYFLIIIMIILVIYSLLLILSIVLNEIIIKQSNFFTTIIQSLVLIILNCMTSIIVLSLNL